MTQAQTWFARLQAVDDNTEIWDAISEVKSNRIHLSFEHHAYAELEDGSLLADSIRANEHGLEEVYASQDDLLKDLSELQEAAMWLAEEHDPTNPVDAFLHGYHGPPLAGNRIELWGTLGTPEYGVDNLDLQFELTRCQHMDGTPALFGSTDYKEEKEDHVLVAYREDLKKDVGRRVRLTAEVGEFQEERATTRGKTYHVKVEYLLAVEVVS